MESRRMTTRSSRRATPLPVSPIKQAVKATGKRGTRKVLADKTNATPVAAVVPSKSPMKATQQVSTPSRTPLPVEQLVGTPVTKGEELLRSLVHSNLSITQTPNAAGSQSTETETPQFGVPLCPHQDDVPSPSPVAVVPSKSPMEAAVPSPSPVTVVLSKSSMEGAVPSLSAVAAVPSKSPMKAAASQQVSTPSRKPLPVEQLPGTPVAKGEELLRSLVHSNLSFSQTPNAAARLSSETETPQFGVPLCPHQDDVPSPSSVAVAPSKSPMEAAVPSPSPVAAVLIKSSMKGAVPSLSAVAAVPSKSPMKAAAAQHASTPSRKLLPVEQLPGTPVAKGEELLRSLVHSNLSFSQTPNAVASLSSETETPQFGIPLCPHQDDVPSPAPVKSEVTTVTERLSAEWVGRDVDEVTEAGDGNDSDCSVLVNVSSPGLLSAASPAPASLPLSTPHTADFKWQRRDSLKVKETEVGECGFNYYEDSCEDYDEYDGEDFGQVIDCEEICQGISRIQVVDQGLPEHKGRHIRFNYNSDDEVDVEEVDVMRLRGLPTPMGKHLRFPEDESVCSP